MPWTNKERPTPFDPAPLPGLHFLHGDVLARRYDQEWTRGQKYPLLRFPSGLRREIVSGAVEERPPSVHLFGALQLPVGATRDEAYALAEPGALRLDCPLRREGERGLVVSHPRSARTYLLTYDNALRQLADIVPYPREAMDLLDGECRAILPPLYRSESLGAEAVAPVKLFAPDSRWTWYVTEFDGDDILFGLVSGFEVELGYFSLSELERVRGPFGLWVERDLYFEPTTLRELEDRLKRGLSP